MDISQKSLKKQLPLSTITREYWLIVYVIIQDPILTKSIAIEFKYFEISNLSRYVFKHVKIYKKEK